MGFGLRTSINNNNGLNTCFEDIQIVEDIQLVSTSIDEYLSVNNYKRICQCKTNADKRCFKFLISHGHTWKLFHESGRHVLIL